MNGREALRFVLERHSAREYTGEPVKPEDVEIPSVRDAEGDTPVDVKDFDASAAGATDPALAALEAEQAKVLAEKSG